MTTTRRIRPSQDIHSTRQPDGQRCECAADAALAAVSHVHVSDTCAYTWAWHCSKLAEVPR
jgi:hypothetical protein